MHTKMSPEAASPSKPPPCITKIIAFFHLSNPRIFLLFNISSIATFCLGIAMILEWSLYSRHHPGYHWIVYYAPSLVALPILLCILCFIYAILSGNNYKDQNLHSQQSRLQVFSHEASRAQLDDFQDQLALVPIEPYNDHPSGSVNKSKHASLSLVALPRNGEDDNSTLKRTVSLPLFHTFTNLSNIKRRMSFG